VSKIAHYLQEHLMGEVTVSADARRHFAHDASVLELAPAIIVYPRNENDVRKAIRFSWQLAERGSILPLTARGGGSDTTGAAIGRGIIMVFPAHMNRILSLDPKKATVTIEPGITYDKLQQTLFTHGLFLPPYPASGAYASLGGGLANNAVGEKSVKYGSMGDYVESLQVVLANGELIETRPLSKKELNRKMGLSSLEGEIYRSLDALLEENHELINKHSSIRTRHNSAGYNLSAVKKNGTFNLTPLIIGSEGTLGVITEATLRLKPYYPATSLALVSLEKLEDLAEVLPKVLALKPSICEMINRDALQSVSAINPRHLSSALDEDDNEIHLLVEFDGPKDAAQKKCIKSLKRIADKAGGNLQIAETDEDKDLLWKIRQSIATTLVGGRGPAKAVPIVEDVSVPVERLAGFLREATGIYRLAGLKPAAWGHTGSGVVRMQPILDLSQLGDRQRLFKISDAVYSLAISLGGSTSAGSGDGRMKAPYLKRLYGPELYAVMMQVKKIFDPHGILNPGVKTASVDDIKTLLRSSYSPAHRYNHLPRS
jgi:FAD/FMN-containing dehydrogenase